MATKLASGTTEALGLDAAPARRLRTIAIEATRNAVDHAYGSGEAGDVEIGVTVGHDDAGAADEIVVSVRDFGDGCPFGPTSADPPGLGLSVMSELSEGLSVKSTKEVGTEVGATIRFPGSPSRPADAEPASHGSRIDFHDPAFLTPLIPRAIGVHAAETEATVDAVRAAIAGGHGIADAIESDAVAEHGATLSIDQPDGSQTLDVTMGPMPADDAEGLRDRLRTRLDPSQRVSLLDPETDGTVEVLVALPLS